LRHPAGFGYRHFVYYFLGFGRANAVDILQPDHHALVGWDIDASDTGHVSSLLYATGAGFSATARPLLPIRLSPEKATK
jgi:hypothetical protein